MIVFDLSCDAGHVFEAWFASSQEFQDQRERGLLSCPHCGSLEIGKAPMAPAVPAKGNQRTEAEERHPVSSLDKLPERVRAAMAALARAQAEALKNSNWVGDAFAEESRAMHYGEKDPRPIHGRVDMEEARELLDEGIAVTPLPFPVSPPDKLN